MAVKTTNNKNKVQKINKEGPHTKFFRRFFSIIICNGNTYKRPRNIIIKNILNKINNKN